MKSLKCNKRGATIGMRTKWNKREGREPLISKFFGGSNKFSKIVMVIRTLLYSNLLTRQSSKKAVK